MARDIKTRTDRKKDVRALDKSKIIGARMKKAFIRTKEDAAPVEQQDRYQSPNEYAEDQVTQTADHAARAVTQQVKDKGRKAIGKVREIRRDVKEARRIEHDARQAADSAHAPGDATRSAGQAAKGQQAGHAGQSAVRPGRVTSQTPQEAMRIRTRDFARQSGVRYRHTVPKSIKSVDQTGKTIKQTAKSTGKGIKGTAKATQKTIKTAKATGKTAIKTSQQAAKAAQRTARAAARAARVAAQTAKAATKAAATTAKAVAKAVVATVKAAIAGVKALVAAIAAGGWVAVVAVLVVLLVGLVAASAFGIFYSGEADGDMTLQQAVQQINQEYLARLDEIAAEVDYDELQMSSTRASWKEVIAVYAVKTTTDPDNPLEVVSMDAERLDRLREVFWDMNQIEYTSESDTIIETIYEDDGNGNLLESTVTTTKTILFITVSGKTADEMANYYNFTEEQHRMLAELLSAEYDSLWSMVLFGISAGSDDIVAVAASQIGQVGGEPYWSWYGLSGRTEWCAIFVSWCAEQCGYIEAGVIPKFATTHTQGVTWFRANGLWQDGSYIPSPGDIIFFDWDNNGDTNHVGIVESVDGTTVYTIEGNSNDAVRRCSYMLGSSDIYGYGVISQ